MSTTRTRQAVAATLGLALLAAGWLLLRNARAPAPAYGPHTPTSTVATTAVDPGSIDASRPLTHSGPTVAPTADPGAPAATEPVLPPPPSGDYELEFSTDQITALVDRRYGGLFRSLRLPPERQARLRSLLIERQQAAIDAANSALLTGLNPIRDLPTINRAIGQAQADIDAALRQELGEQAFAALTESERAQPARRAIATLARELSATPDPLRPEQEKQLLQLLLNPAAEMVPADLNQAIFGPVNAGNPISDQAVALATPVLSPQQLQRFRELQQGKGDGPLQPN